MKLMVIMTWIPALEMTSPIQGAAAEMIYCDRPRTFPRKRDDYATRLA